MVKLVNKTMIVQATVVLKHTTLLVIALCFPGIYAVPTRAAEAPETVYNKDEIGRLSNDNLWNCDEVVAHMPWQVAASRPAAMARVNIMLHRAKRRTEDQLCGGAWVSNGRLVTATAPRYTSARGYWSYRARRKPVRNFICAGHSRTAFLLEMSRHLPAWISISPAELPFSFGQGIVIDEDKHFSAAGTSQQPRFSL